MFGRIDAVDIRGQHLRMNSNCRRCGAPPDACKTATGRACAVCGADGRPQPASIPSLAFALLYLSLIAATIWLGLQPPV